MSSANRKQYHKMVTEFENKVMDKYSYTPSNSFKTGEDFVRGRSKLDDAGNPINTRYRKYNAVSKAVSYSSYKRRMGEVTTELIENLINYAPFRTGYGQSHMFKKIDRFNGNIELGTENPMPGQTTNAPYMVHLNATPICKWNGWIEDAIEASQEYATALNINIWSPKYFTGLAIIRCRASEQDDEWYEDSDYNDKY